jgi:Flp pilus assembly secretin CpaC
MRQHDNSTVARRAVAAGWAFGLALLTAVGAEVLDLRLSPEASARLDVPAGIRKVFISNPSIVDAQPDGEGTALLVTGLKTGKAEVRISRLTGDDLVYRVEVEPELQDLANQVRDMLADVEGLEVKVLGDRIVLEGELLTRASAEQAEAVADAFGNQVVNLTKLDEAGYTRNVKKALEREIKIKTVVVKVDGERLILTGSVPSQRELERVKEIAKKRAEKVTILLQVRPPRG